MGHAAPFDFVADYAPASGIGRQLCGTPSVLAMTVLETAVDLLLRADMAILRDKSNALIDVFMILVKQECGEFGLEIVTPLAGDQRGSQVALRHDEGYGIMRALIAREVIGDFRAPDILRFGITPLYQLYTDMWDAVSALRDVMETQDMRRGDKWWPPILLPSICSRCCPQLCRCPQYSQYLRQSCACGRSGFRNNTEYSESGPK